MDSTETAVLTMRILLAVCAAAFSGLAGAPAWAGKAPVGTIAAATPGAAIPIAAIARLPALAGPRLSPDGKHIAVLVPVDGRRRLMIREWGAAGGSHVMTAFADAAVRRFRWLNDKRLLVRQDFQIQRVHVDYIEERYSAINADGTGLIVLWSSLRRLIRPRKPRDFVIDILTQDPDHILVRLTKPDHRIPGVFKMNVETGARSSVLKSRHHMRDWMTDGDGVIRLGFARSRAKTRILWRPGEDDKWLLARRFDSGRGEVFVPLAFAAGRSRIYVLSNHESDRDALYEFDLAEKRFVRRLFAHDQVDIGGLLFSPDGEKLIGIHYVLEHSEIEYLDDDAAAEQRRIDSLLPHKVNRITSRDRDGARAIVFSTGDTDPGSYFMWQPASAKLTPLGKRYPDIEPASLAAMKPLSYRARDGLRIPGYLTLPVGAEGQKLPLIVIPHGGPVSRESQRFDYWTQFLASRGYAVFHPNFRGSSGFGRTHLSAGYRQWGMAMQDDITDGVQWLISEGVADPERICIVGASFGGYAALMGALRTPGLYKCVVSFAGLSDLVLGVAFGQNYMNSAIHSMKTGRATIDSRRLMKVSPARHARRIQAPVLLFHGDDDKIVPIAHSILMAEALERAQKRHEFVILPGGDHRLSDEKNRLALFTRLEAFLLEHLGPVRTSQPASSIAPSASFQASMPPLMCFEFSSPAPRAVCTAIAERSP